MWRRLYRTRGVAVGYGTQLRAVFDDVVLAEYRCHYGRHDYKVADIRAGVFYPKRFASPPAPADLADTPGVPGSVSPAVAPAAGIASSHHAANGTLRGSTHRGMRGPTRCSQRYTA
jgi:hypothetical protein